MQVTFRALVEQQAHGRATIHLIKLPDDEADFLASLGVPRGGFGSIKVNATIGDTTWRTSLFPDGESFILLVARKLLAAEQVEVGDAVLVALDIIV